MKIRILRDDVLVAPLEGKDGCIVTDAQGASYEFGAMEYHLITQIQSPYRVEEVLAACREHFQEEISEQDFHEFLDMLDGWGLLQQVDQMRAPVEESRSSHREADDESGRILLQQLDQANRWHLCNPEPALDRAYRLLYPLRRMVWMLPFLVAFSLVALMSNIGALLHDLSYVLDRFGLLGRILVMGAVLSLVTQLARGVVARHYQLPVPSLGIIFMLGLLPRFNVRVHPAGVASLDRSARLWLTSISTIVRLFLFSLGVLLWAVMHASGSFLALAGIELALVALISTLFVANPLIPGDGANFISAWLGLSGLHSRSKWAVKSLFVRQPAVILRHSRHRFSFALFGLASLTFIVLFLGFILYRVFGFLEGHFQGAGVSLFLLLAVYVVWQMRRQRRSMRPLAARHSMASRTGEGISGRGRSAGNSASGHRFGWLWFSPLLLLLFLPYRYETGGDAEIFPSARATLSFADDGIVDSISVHSGQWVEAGDTLAVIAHARQEKDVAVTEAGIEAKRYAIQQLMNTPSAEDVRLAEAAIATAALQLQHSQEELARIRPLYKKKLLSPEEFERAENDVELKRQQWRQARLALDALKAQVDESQIDALRSEVKGMEQELRFFREELRRTVLKAPIVGRVVTEDIGFKRHAYVRKGDVFIEIEDTRVVSARIAVPEADAGDIKLGAQVHLKLWAYPERVFEGKVDEIEPVAKSLDFGRVVYIRSRIDNPEGILLSGLTGYAKVSGENTLLIFAFTRALARFFRVEVWSWIP